jgi:flagellar hook-basal body complex protein FliE
LIALRKEAQLGAWTLNDIANNGPEELLRPEWSALSATDGKPTDHEDSSTPSAASAKSFKEVLAERIFELQRLRAEADSLIEKLVSGRVNDVPEAMVAVETAAISFQAMMRTRAQVVAAYQEAMSTQL